MTVKQQAFIESLRDDMGLSNTDIDDIADDLFAEPHIVTGVAWTACNTEEASLLIDELLQRKRKGDY